MRSAALVSAKKVLRSAKSTLSAVYFTGNKLNERQKAINNSNAADPTAIIKKLEDRLVVQRQYVTLLTPAFLVYFLSNTLFPRTALYYTL